MATTPTRRTESLAAFIGRVAPAHAQVPRHLQALVALLERAAREPVRALVSMPPRHGKTETICTALAWLAVTQPWRTHAYVTYAATQAYSKSRKVRRLAIAGGSALADDAAAVHDWRTPADGGLLATGIGGPLTGQGITGLLVLDDPLKNREEAESPLIRDKVAEWFGDVAYTRLEPGASCLVVATRWHEDDLIGRLSKQARWESLVLPAISEDGRALWPEQYPLEALEEIRAQIGDYGFWSLYQASPRPRGGAVFKREPLRFEGSGREGRRIVLSVDAAGTESTRSDYTVAVAMAFAGFGAATTCRVIDMVRVQLEPQDSAKVLRDFQRRNGGGPLVIEASRDGIAIAKALRSIDRDLVIHERKPIGDKFSRAQPFAAAWNGDPDAKLTQRVAIPADAQAHPWVAPLLAELRTFTGVGDKHDDIVDALAQGWNEGVRGAPVHRIELVGAERPAGW